MDSGLVEALDRAEQLGPHPVTLRGDAPGRGLRQHGADLEGRAVELDHPGHGDVANRERGHLFSSGSGPTMVSGRTTRSNCSGVTCPSCSAASRKVSPLWWACLAISAALS